MKATLFVLFAVVCCALATSYPITIVHITDVHGWINGHPHNNTLNADFGDFQAFLSHYKKQTLAAGQDFLLLDSGDLIEGTGISDCTDIHGEYVFPIIQQIQMYDALTIGNHDIGHNNVVDLMRQDFIPYWNGSYLTANALWMDDLRAAESSGDAFMGNPYRVVVLPQSGLKVLILGYIYNFTQNANATEIEFVADSLAQKYFEQAMAIEDIAIVIVVCHIAPQPWTDVPVIQKAIRKAKPTTPIILLSGHSHVEYFQWYDSRSFTMESGKYFEEIGLLTFNYDESYLDDVAYTWETTSRENFMDLTDTDNKTFMTEQGLSIKKNLAAYSALLNLDEVYGCSPATYNYLGLYTQPTSFYYLLLNSIVPKILLQTSRPNTQMYITNTAFLRYSLYEGKVTRNDVYTACGFNDTYLYYPSLQGSFITSLVNAFEDDQDAVAMGRRQYGCLEEVYNPAFIHTPATITASTTYDLICSRYDCVALQNVAKQRLGKTINFEIYAGAPTDTYMIGDYVKKYMPCSSEEDMKLI